MTWPSSAGILLTCTDALGRITQIKDAADCSTATSRLALYAYDDLSRRISVTRPSGANSSYTYEDTGTLDTLGHALGGGAAVNYGFNYNQALQIASRSTDNDLYAWTNHYNVTRSYTANGLDQYGRIMGDTPAWDSRGNLAAYRGSSYGFDGENRLAAVNLPSGTVTTAYDPAGRLRQTAASTGAQFLYDGDQLIAEYNASGGALVGRYVPGAGANETALAYDGAGTKSWYHGDAQGSVVAASDASGNAVTINQYGPYGEPGTVYQGRNQGRVRYTGQTILSEAGTTTGINQILYNYRARIYAPKLGRFLQTDPIGAQDDRNLYAYVANDPINRTDLTGLMAEKLLGSDVRLGADAAGYLGVGGGYGAGISYNASTGQVSYDYNVRLGVGYGAYAGGSVSTSINAPTSKYPVSASIDANANAGAGIVGGSAQYNLANRDRGGRSPGQGLSGSGGLTVGPQLVGAKIGAEVDLSVQIKGQGNLFTLPSLGGD